MYQFEKATPTPDRVHCTRLAALSRLRLSSPSLSRRRAAWRRAADRGEGGASFRSAGPSAHRGNAARTRHPWSMRPRGHGRPRNQITRVLGFFPVSRSHPLAVRTRARLHAHALTIICQNICDMPDTHAHRRPQTEGPSVCRTLFGGRLPPGVLSQEREGPA